MIIFEIKYLLNVEIIKLYFNNNEIIKYLILFNLNFLNIKKYLKYY